MPGRAITKGWTLAKNSEKQNHSGQVAQLFSQDDIAARLGAEILSGARKPGELMPSGAEMLETFGVSRVVTREVIKTLTAKGMVATKLGVGTIIQDPGAWNWFDSDLLSWRVKMGLDAEFLQWVTEVRRVVEPAAASLAAQNRTREDVANLRKYVRSMAEAGQDHRQWVHSDLAFHVTISRASGNPFFRSISAVIETALFAFFSLNLTVGRKALQNAVVKHSEIVDAIEAKDADAAAEAMLRTISVGHTHSRQAQRERGRSRAQ